MTTRNDEHANHGAPKDQAAQGALPPPPPIAPLLAVRGAKDAIAFYERAFGARVTFRNDTPDGQKILHASLELPNGGVFMVHDDFSEIDLSRPPEKLGGTTVTISLDVPDVDAAWKRALEAGAEEVSPLEDRFWGDRHGVVRDPFGHRWGLSTRKREVSQEQIEDATEKLGTSG